MSLLAWFQVFIIAQGIITPLLVLAAIFEKAYWLRRLAILWLIFGAGITWLLIYRWVLVDR